MKIGVDIQALQTESKTRGIGRYSYNWLKAMLSLYPKEEYVFFASGLYGKESLPFATIPHVTYDIIDYLPYHDLNLVNGVLQYIHYEENDMDLLQILSPFEHLDKAVICPKTILPSAQKQGQVKKKIVVILYDLIPFLFPHLYLEGELLKREYFQRLEVVKTADLLLCISEATRQDAIQHLGILPEKCVNIGGGVSEDFYHIEHIELDAVQRIKAKYRLGEHFILDVGGIDKRKNIEGLIQAFSLLPQELQKKYPLVFVCPCQERETNVFQKLGKKQKVKGDLIFLHHVPDSDLNLLYNLCDLVVLPSFYEGFGLTILEAMKCGAPVLASNNSSIPEVSGRRDNLFDPQNTENIASLLEKALKDHAFLQELRVYGRERARKFSWENVAQKTMEAYQKLISSEERKVQTVFSPEELRIQCTHLVEDVSHLLIQNSIEGKKKNIDRVAKEIYEVYQKKFPALIS